MPLLCGDRSKLLVGLVQEFLGGDHGALVGAFADLSGFIIGGDIEGDDILLHSGNFRLCPHIQTHGGCGDVRDIQGNAHGGLAFGDGFGDGFAGSAFHQSHHARGSIDQKGAGTHLGGSVLAFHAAADFGLGLSMVTEYV